MTFCSTDTDIIVRAMIVAAGLRPDPDEIDSAVAHYPALLACVTRLHELDIDHEEDLAVTFEA